jgi:hypothetical protein
MSAERDHVFPEPNQSVEPTGGSRSSQPECVSQGRLPPVAHAHRSAMALAI